ncbi:MAG TPA: hypothetical protein VIV55_09905 [Flavobacterium sp.]
MGYSFYLISKDKEITQEDFDKAFSKMSVFNQRGRQGNPPCDVSFKKNYINVSGAYGISGKDSEGFVLNLWICLQDLGYGIRILCGDWDYGSAEDWDWLRETTRYANT